MRACLNSLDLGDWKLPVCGQSLLPSPPPPSPSACHSSLARSGWGGLLVCLLTVRGFMGCLCSGWAQQVCVPLPWSSDDPWVFYKLFLRSQAPHLSDIPSFPWISFALSLSWFRIIGVNVLASNHAGATSSISPHPSPAWSDHPHYHLKDFAPLSDISVSPISSHLACPCFISVSC